MKLKVLVSNFYFIKISLRSETIQKHLDQCLLMIGKLISISDDDINLLLMTLR